MADLLSWNIPAHLSGGLDGAAVVAGIVEVSGAQACQHQSILERSLSVTRYSTHLKIVNYNCVFEKLIVSSL